MSRTIELKSKHLVIDGVPRVLLCASLFPFRIVRNQWRQRLSAVKKIGYHAIDVYVPWNYHETSPGTWDFTGQHDIEEFLKLTREAGLYALVRPGPYICSEWDGGGIPAWISTDPATKIRQNDNSFIEAVDAWYDRIMPIIRRQQYTEGGSVIMVQADNELDFFDCDDPSAYIGKLAAMMTKHDITIPIIACAGQGDMSRACGDVAGVTPTVNLYPNDDSIDVDSSTRYYKQACNKYDIPLIVTETNRLHRTLRRLIGSGAQFVGPYLQVSGWDFDYGTSVNNWGSLEAFMTHDYDFGGVIDPGGNERPDADEARRLSLIISALGTRLALAELSHEPLSHILTGNGFDIDDPTQGMAHGCLDLEGGGKLLTLTNVSTHTMSMRPKGLTPTDGAHLLTSHRDIRIPAGTGAMLLHNVPLAEGITLDLSSAEPTELSGTTTVLSPPITAPGVVWATLNLSEDLSKTVLHMTGDVHVQRSGTRVLLWGNAGSLTFLDEQDSCMYIIEIKQPRIDYTRPEEHAENLYAIDVAHHTALWRDPLHRTSFLPPSLEAAETYSGAGRYTGHHSGITHVCGIVLRNACDIVEARYGTQHSGWHAANGDIWLPAEDTQNGKVTSFEVTARIWGHSNFDDSRVGSLKLSAHRGIDGCIAVQHIVDLNSGWLVKMESSSSSFVRPDSRFNHHVNIGSHPVPRSNLGSLSTTTWPNSVIYTKTICLDGFYAAVHMKHTQARCDIILNGKHIGFSSPWRPTVWLGPIHSGDRLSIIVNKTWGEDPGNIALLIGKPINDWNLRTQSLTELRETSQSLTFAEIPFPLRVDSPDGIWMRIPHERLWKSNDSMNTTVRMDGEGIQLTAFTAHYCLGRVVLGGIPGTVFAGGRGDLFLIPREEGDVILYAEPTRSSPGILRSLTVGERIDRY